MSADNFITVERKGKKWIINNGCASTYFKRERKEDGKFNTRDEAIDRAQEIIEDELIEYGLAYIEPLKDSERTNGL